MYEDLKRHFWWKGMKSHITEYVNVCLAYQKAKFEHRRPPGLVESLTVPYGKCDDISRDFVV